MSNLNVTPGYTIYGYIDNIYTYLQADMQCCRTRAHDQHDQHRQLPLPDFMAELRIVLSLSHGPACQTLTRTGPSTAALPVPQQLTQRRSAAAVVTCARSLRLGCRTRRQRTACHRGDPSEEWPLPGRCRWRGRCDMLLLLPPPERHRAAADAPGKDGMHAKCAGGTARASALQHGLAELPPPVAMRRSSLASLGRENQVPWRMRSEGLNCRWRCPGRCPPGSGVISDSAVQ